MEDIIRSELSKLRSSHRRSVKEFKGSYKIHNLALTLKELWTESKAGRSAIVSLSQWGAGVSLFLAEGDTLSRDVMVFIDEVSERIDSVLPGGFSSKETSSSYDFHWGSLIKSLEVRVYYSESCKRVQIGVKTEIVETPVFKVVCV